MLLAASCSRTDEYMHDVCETPNAVGQHITDRSAYPSAYRWDALPGLGTAAPASDYIARSFGVASP